MHLYDAEAWTLSNTDAAVLGVFERKVLLKNLGPVRVGNDYCIRTKPDNDMDVEKCINIQQFRWLSHIVWIDEDAPLRRLFEALFDGHWRLGRTHTLWKDQVKEALTSLGVTNWGRLAQSRGAWREALRQVEPDNWVVMVT